MQEIDLDYIISHCLISSNSDISDYQNRIQLFRNCPQRNLISVWKPRNEFHMGQYFCLLTLSRLLENDSHVEIIIGTNEEDEPKLALDEKISFTIAFIRRMSKSVNPDEISIIPINNLKYDNYDEYYKRLTNYIYANSATNIFARRLEERKWINNTKFTNNLIQIIQKKCIENNDGKNNLFIVCGEKHLDIWETIAGFLSDEYQIHNLIPIYINNIWDSNKKPMSFNTRVDEIFISFNESSKNKIQKTAKRIVDQCSDENTNEIYQRMINQVVLVAQEKYGEKTFNQLKNNEDKVDFITQFISEKVNRWINIKSEVLNFEKKIEVNNSFLIHFLQRKYSIPEDTMNFFFENEKEKGNIDICPENFRDGYRSLVKHCYKTIKDNFKKDDEYINQFEVLIQKSSNIDLFSYFAEKWHRDHYLHQFNVAALGEFFLSIYSRDGITLLDEISTRQKIDKNEILFSWWTAALLHDHAYPMEKIIKVIGRIGRLERTYGVEGFASDVVSTMKKTGVNSPYFENLFSIILNNDNLLDENIYLDLQQFGEKIFSNLRIESEFDLYNHAHLAVVNICSYLGFREKDQINVNKIPSWLVKSIKAISIHHDEKINISLANEPISFLLVLCDELQEWTRRQMTKENNNFKFTHSIDVTKIELIKKNIENFSFPKELQICFNCLDLNSLDNIGWDSNIFLKTKKSNISRLNFHENRDDFLPHLLKYSVNIFG